MLPQSAEERRGFLFLLICGYPKLIYKKYASTPLSMTVTLSGVEESKL